MSGAILREVPDSVMWDYDASVGRVRPMVLRWGQLTVNMLGELHTAREALSKTGYYPRAGETNVPPRTWDGYCTDVGLEKRTANRWLLRYDPERRCVRELPAPESVTPAASRVVSAIVALDGYDLTEHIAELASCADNPRRAPEMVLPPFPVTLDDLDLDGLSGTDLPILVELVKAGIRINNKVTAYRVRLERQGGLCAAELGKMLRVSPSFALTHADALAEMARRRVAELQNGTP